MGNIITKNIMYMIHKRLIPNSPITCDELKAANNSFGTNIKVLKVKTVRKSGENV